MPIVFDDVLITGSLNGTLQTSTGVGTPEATVTQSTIGDGRNFVTTLTLTETPLLIGDGAALASGALIYTLPAGVQFIDYAYMSVGLTATDEANAADTPEIGIGTLIGSGVAATLGAVDAAAENIIEGSAAADCTGTAEVVADIPTANIPLVRLAADDKTIYLNIADTYANNTVQTATLSGTVVLKWTQLA